MNVSARSYISAGVAALTAGVIAIPTSIEPLVPPTALSASVQQERVALLAAARSFTAPIEPPVAFVVLAPQHAVAPTAAPNSSPGAVVKTAPTAAVAAAAPAAQAALAGIPGIQDAIINAYNVIDPWVDYGVNLAQYAVGWIPVVGIFAPQIGIFYYDLIEPIATSAIFNTAYVLGGSIGLVQGISNVINDSINAGIGFVNAQISWALSFLPPLPPLPFAATQTTALKVAAETTTGPTTEAADGTVAEKHESSVATSAEPVAKPAAPEATKSPTQPAAEAATEPATPKPEAEPATTKPEAEPVKKPESTTTDASGGVAAQGEVRGGTQSATDQKKPDETAPASKPDDKGDGDAASTANKPAESSPGATKTSEASKTGDADKSGDANKSVGSVHGA
jgi:hypothetical protein